jgi:hypothetical protein
VVYELIRDGRFGHELGGGIEALIPTDESTMWRVLGLAEKLSRELARTPRRKSCHEAYSDRRSFGT